MQKRYQVFISSTFRDLQEERKEVIQAILELEGIPTAMEIWPSSSDDSWTLIRRMIQESDYYLVVVGGKYGSVDSEGLSYTEREYNLAVELGKPVMAFVHADFDSLPVKKVELDQPMRERLRAFRERLLASRFTRQWSTVPELGGMVSRSFASMRSSHPGTGWVRADQSLDPAVAVELARARETIRELEGRIESVQRAPPARASGLCSGGDKTYVRYNSSLDFGNHKAKRRADGKLWMTWDSVFAVLGPHMFEPIREDSVSELLRRHVIAFVVRKRKAERAEGTIWGADFQRIKIQLRALGLIDRAPRPPNDFAHVFWQLTPYGEDYLAELLAEKRAD